MDGWMDIWMDDHSQRRLSPWAVPAAAAPLPKPCLPLPYRILPLICTNLTLRVAELPALPGRDRRGDVNRWFCPCVVTLLVGSSQCGVFVVKQRMPGKSPE